MYLKNVMHLKDDENILLILKMAGTSYTIFKQINYSIVTLTKIFQLMSALRT